MPRFIRLAGLLVMASFGAWGCEDDAGGELCGSVCWEPGPPVPSSDLLGWSEGEGQECNVGGLAGGVCPVGTACTGRQTSPWLPPTLSQRVCEPTQPIERLIFELPGDAPSASGVDVRLRFTMNGGAWPASVVGQAGTVLITPAEGVAGRQELDVPTTPDGELPLKLLPGRYRVLVRFDNGVIHDSANYPPGALMGTLEVNGPGSAAIDVQARKVAFSVTIDGQPVGQLTGDEYMVLNFWDSEGRLSYAWFWGGAHTTSSITLRPGTYRPELYVGTSKRLPMGRTTMSPGIVVGPTDVPPVQLSAESTPLSGRVLVDGADLPAGVTGEVVINTEAIAISETRPATYSTRVFPGPHDVGLRLHGLPGLPQAYAPVATGVVMIGPSYDIAVATVPFSAEVTVNGAAPPEVGTESRGYLSVGGTGFPIPATGPAVVSGRVLQLATDVTISTPGGLLPAGQLTVAKQHRPTGDRVVFDVKTTPVRMDLTYNGQVPPFGTPTLGRGYLEFYRTDDGAGDDRVSVYITEGGPVSVSAGLPHGTYGVRYQSFGSYEHLPQGVAHLGTIVVGNEPVSRTFDMQGTEVVVELRRNGMPLPAVPHGGAGTVTATRLLGDDPLGAWSSDLPFFPREGSAQPIKLYRGVWQLRWTCGQDCGYPTKESVLLVNGLRLP